MANFDSNNISVLLNNFTITQAPNLIVPTRTSILTIPTQVSVKDIKPINLNNKLVKVKNKQVIYFIENNKKRLIVSSDIFKKNGYSMKNVVTVDEKNIKNIPLGEYILYKDGKLLKNNGKIYLVQNGKLRLILNTKIFKKYKFKKKDVISITSKVFEKYKIDKVLN